MRSSLHIVLCSVFLVAWIPFLWLSFFNVPIGMHEWEWMTDYAGRFTGSWWELQQHLYSNVMGRYTSNGLLSLTSSWCTLSNFPFFFFFWQIIWLVAILMLLRTVFREYSWWLTMALSFGIQILYLFKLEDVYDSLYRYTALLTYQAGTIFAMVAALLFAYYEHRGKKHKAVLLGGLAFMVMAVGTNEVSMLIVLIASSVLFLYHRFYKKGKSTTYLTALVIAFIAGLVVLLAPGNGLRMESEDGGMDLIRLIYLTISTSAFIWIEWMGSVIFILLTILAIPLISHYVKSSLLPSLFNDYKPWLMILILIVPANMILLIYSTGGNAFPERVIDHLFIHVVFVWLGFIISFSRRTQLFEEVIKMSQNKFARIAYMLCVGVVIGHIFFSGIDVDRTKKSNPNYLSLIQSDANILNAWLTILRGDAATYHRVSMIELMKLYECFSTACFVRKPQILPEQLYDPLSDRRNRNGDGYIGYYFDPRIKVVKYLQIE